MIIGNLCVVMIAYYEAADVYYVALCVAGCVLVWFCDHPILAVHRQDESPEDS